MAQMNIIFQVSRTSPALDGDILYFATEPFALLVALNRITGQEIAYSQINPHPYAVATMSPTVWNGTVFIGTSSREEAIARKVPSYPCCSFIGNFAAFQLDSSSHQFNVMWNVSTLPLTGDWSGGSVWGSQPSIDVRRQQVFIATGNVYSLPTEYEACYKQTSNISVIQEGLVSDPCVPSNVYQETVLALDIATGFVNWERQLSPLDAWTAACGFGGSIQKPNTSLLPQLCPYRPGPDADFGMAPTFIPASAYTPHEMDTLVIGQKNGNLYALGAQTGKVFWATVTCPDGNVGGLSWGIAVDDSRVYYTAINSDLKTFRLQPDGPTINSSAFGAASLTDGSILWETPSPNGTFAISPPTVANDIVFFAREDSGPSIEAYETTVGGLIPVDKFTGTILADYPLQAIMHGGISVVGEYVMFGTGYEPSYNGTGEIVVMSVG